MESTNPDLAIFLHTDSYGGTERHTLGLLSHIDNARLSADFFYSGEGLNGHIPGGYSSVRAAKVKSKVQKLTQEDIKSWRKVLKRNSAKRALLVKPSYFSIDLKLLFLLRFNYRELIVIEHSLPPRRPPLQRIGVIPMVGYWRLKNEVTRYLFNRLVDRVIAVSDIGKTELYEQTFYRDIKVCGNGINTNTWVRDVKKGDEFRSQNGIDLDLHVFGCVGNLFTGKAFHVAIEALSMLSKLHRKGVALCIVGVGPEHENLKALAERLNLENVFFVGKQFDMVAAYSAMQTLLVTSVSESASLALLEATACDCDVLSTDVGIASEVINEMNNGVVIESHKPEVWAREIEAYLDRDRCKSEDLQVSRKSRFKNKYSIEKTMSNLVSTIMRND